MPLRTSNGTNFQLFNNNKRADINILSWEYSVKVSLCSTFDTIHFNLNLLQNPN